MPLSIAAADGDVGQEFLRRGDRAIQLHYRAIAVADGERLAVRRGDWVIQLCYLFIAVADVNAVWEF